MVMNGDNIIIVIINGDEWEYGNMARGSHLPLPHVGDEVGLGANVTLV